MRWLRGLAFVIFIFVLGYCIPYTVRNPIFSNILITLIALGMVIWIGFGFSKKPKQPIQQQN